MSECTHHVWVTNSGRGGAPFFKPGPNGPKAPHVMHVNCLICNARTWFSEQQWKALEAKATLPSHKADLK